MVEADYLRNLVHFHLYLIQHHLFRGFVHCFHVDCLRADFDLLNLVDLVYN